MSISWSCRNNEGRQGLVLTQIKRAEHNEDAVPTPVDLRITDCITTLAGNVLVGLLLCPLNTSRNLIESRASEIFFSAHNLAQTRYTHLAELLLLNCDLGEEVSCRRLYSAERHLQHKKAVEREVT